MLDRLFRLSESNTTVRTELLAGLTTFLTMAYIIFVQPAVLSKDFAGNPTGLDFGAVLLGTCLAAAAACIAMGLWARYPVALAPGMGENFFFVSVLMSLSALGVSNAWQVGLGIVFISSIVVLVLSLTRARETVFNAISPSMRNAIAVAIGLFIAFIGLQHGKVIVGSPGSLVKLTPHIASADVAVFALGFLATCVLYLWRVRGAVLWGIAVAAVLAVALGKVHAPGQLVGLPEIRQSAVLQFDLAGALTWAALPFIVIFVFMDFFDAVGTLTGVSEQAGFVKDGKLPRVGRALIVDAAGTVLGACLGTTTVTSYIESTAGIAFGGRTGLTAVTVGLLFLLALFFSPIIKGIAEYYPITAPALVFVGAVMIGNVRKIDWDDHSEGIPAFLTILAMPLCYSIADGLAFGFISYPILKLLGGRGREVSWLMYLLAAALVAYFVLVRAG